MGRHEAYLHIALLRLLKYIVPLLLIILLPFVFLFSKLSILLIFLLLILNFVHLKRIINYKTYIKKESGDILYSIGTQTSKVLLILCSNFSKKDFSMQNWSQAWINTLEQELGSFKVIKSQNLDSKILADIKVIILGKISASELNKKQNKFIDEFINKGGIIIIEEAAEADELVEKGKITKINIQGFEELKSMPIFTRLNSKKINGNSIIEINSRPAIILENKGKGNIIHLMFDYSLQLVSLQQGKPEEDYKIRKKQGIKDMLEPADIILSPRLEQNNIPYADILERMIIRIIEEKKPIASFYYYPKKYDGCVIITHDEDYIGDEISKISELESYNKSKSTYFIAGKSKISKKTIRNIKNIKGDAQFHFDRMIAGAARFLFIRLDERKLLNNQLSCLHSKIKNKIIANRNHFMKLDNHYTNSFRLLEQKDILIDSTYGPTTGKGYLFGTGMPFHPIDTNGNLMKIQEIPTIIQDDRGGCSSDYINKLFEDSKRKYHQTINILLHPHFILKKKSNKDYFLNIINKAKNSNHWIATVSEYYDFIEKRKKSTLKEKIKGNSIMIECYSEYSGLCIKIPSENISSIAINGKKSKFEYKSIESKKYAVFELKQGKNTIKIIKTKRFKNI